MQTARRKTQKGDRKRPNITVIIEASFASGRNTVRGIAQYARQHGPWLFHHEWRNTDLFFPAWLDQWQGDGFIARVENRKIARALARLDVPVVDVLGTLPKPLFPIVRVDDGAIARLAAQHLLHRGFEHFAYCGLKGLSWSDQRGRVFREAVAEEGCDCAFHEWEALHRHSWSWDQEVESMIPWLKALPKPAGILLSNDLHAHVVLEACHRGGIAVPDQVALVGVDNDEAFCEICEPPLSSIDTNDLHVGYEAAALLDAWMRGKAAPEPGVVRLVEPKRVVPRLSSDVLAVHDPPVAAAVRYIRENAVRGISVDDVVRHVPLSRSLLQRRYRKTLGRTIHDDILHTRLSHAKMLLADSSMPLVLVAERSGFNHQAYMGAVFKREVGITPLEYRRRFGSEASGE